MRISSCFFTLVYQSHFGSKNETDVNGECIIHELKETIYDSQVKSWSDSAQAETGDNGKWTRTISKFGYVTPTEEEQWAGVNSSFGLTASSVIFTITNQIHDITSPYNVDFGDIVTVTASYTGTESCWAEINGKYFLMTLL